MRIGIANEETWAFFHDVYRELSQHHDVSQFTRPAFNAPVFNERINRWLFSYKLQNFMERQDVVFFEWASGLLADASHLPKRAKIVIRLHRYELYRWANKVNWDAVDTIIMVSEAKKHEFVSRFPQQVEKIVVIPVGIDMEKFRPVRRRFSGALGTLCHLRPRKRVYELILTFYELIQRRDDVHLHIGGGEAPGFAEYSRAIHTLVNKLQLQDRVTFYGHVANQEEWYRGIDIFISNSYSEGLQVAPMEAVASGCYCLSHYWDGADELLPAEDLYFSDAELLERLERYCEADEEERAQWRMRQREIVCQRFDAEKINTKIREVVEATV